MRALVAIALVSAWPAWAAPEDLYALVIGHNGGGEGLPDLRFADDDAVRFALLFAGLGGPDRVWLLTELDADTRASLEAAGLVPPPSRSPTRSALAAALEELRVRLSTRDRSRPAAVYIVYAGHGLQGRLLLQPEHGASAAVTGRELKSALSTLEADRAVLLLDACRSQSLFTERGGPDLSEQIDALERSAARVRLGVLAAATSDTPAGESARLRAGLFSHVLASALAGAADADGDDVVSFGELAAFAAFNTERLTRQRPWFSPPDGDLTAPAIDHRGRPTRLVLPASESGRYRVDLATRGAAPAPVFAELFKAPGRPVALSLPAGRYRVTHLERDGAFAGEVELVVGRATQVTRSALVEAVAAEPRERGTDLEGGFPAPFTSEVVTALAVGYQSGREPPAAIDWTHALGLSWGVGPAPFGLPGLEQGLALSYRRAWPRWLAGARLDARTASFRVAEDSLALRRVGLMAQTGLRLRVAGALWLEGAGALGLRAIWRERGGSVTSGDFTAPAAQAALSLEHPLGAHLSAFLDARVELTLVAVDGRRQPFVEPSAALGVSWRL